MRSSAWMLAGALALPLPPVLAADGDGLRSAASQVTWARWQGRLSLVTVSDPWRLGVERPAVSVGGASLMGDYYLSRPWFGSGQQGGLRATSGLIYGARSLLSANTPGLATGSAFSIGSRTSYRPALPLATEVPGDATTLPYLGIGYTGLAARSGWSYSADLGVLAPGGLGRAGRAVGAGPSLEDQVRELRLAPLLQLGVSYSF